MKKPNLSQLAKSTRTLLSKHSPEILTGIGITGMITTTIMAVKATPKALDAMVDIKTAHEEEPKDKKAMGKDILKYVVPVYIPAAVTGALSVTCLIGASSVNARRRAALATAYALSEQALKEYQEKVIETIGEKKEQAVRDSIAKDKIDKNPVTNTEVIITEKGNTLCYDAISGRYFKSDIEKLRKIENELNRQMISEMYISLNDFYYEVGLPATPMGNDLGWNIDRGFIELAFSSQLSEDETPCLVVGYHVEPKYNFR